MSRQHNFIGLNEWASKKVMGNQIHFKEQATRTYDDGRIKTIYREGQDSDVVRSVLRTIDAGWYDETMDLNQYHFPDGTVMEEYVQNQPWSSGPCTFLALKELVPDPKNFGGFKREVVPESLWTDEEIANA